jgi:phage shock protein E
MSITRLSPEEFKASIAAQPGIVVDVRTPQEVIGGSLVDASTADFLGGEFEQVYPNWDKSQTYYLYCRSGTRSGAAAQIMANAGFANVFNIGGYEELKAGGVE